MGQSNSRGVYYHASPVGNRASIEQRGLLPEESKNSLEDERGRDVYRRAVFVSRSQSFMRGVADHLALNNHYGDGKSDIWEVNTSQTPKADEAWEGAEMFTRKLPSSAVKRIGHITEGGEVHWHPEEQCPN